MGYVAVDQYGNTWWLKRHPRKELMAKLGYRSAQRIYRDTRDGRSWRVGYLIGPHVIDVFGLEGTTFRKVV